MPTDAVKTRTIVLQPEDKRQGRFDHTSGLVYIISPAVLLAVWQIVGLLGWIDLRFFPLPSQIAVTFYELLVSGEWFVHVGATLGRVLFGFIVGSALGIVVGALMGLVPWIRFCVYPLVASIYPIPKIAIFPLILLIFGLGEASKLVTISASCFFFLAISAMSGVLNIPRVYMDVGRNFGARGLDFIWTVAIPAALPVIFSGLKLALGAAFLVVVSLEFINAESGIGWQIWRSWELFSIRMMFVSLLTVSFLGLILVVALDWLERKLVPWHL
ncbi:MAG TPA: ABC transporter permease [Xanthobacteraceae bacterium]|nr:ABC transporter permease [Xanthobacteraceae bacterium]